MSIKMEHIPVVIEAKYTHDYCIDLTFDNGVRKEVDFKKWIGEGIFQPLENIDYFKNFFLDGWTVCWENGADIDPEDLYI